MTDEEFAERLRLLPDADLQRLHDAFYEVYAELSEGHTDDEAWELDPFAQLAFAIVEPLVDEDSRRGLEYEQFTIELDYNGHRITPAYLYGDVDFSDVEAVRNARPHGVAARCTCGWQGPAVDDQEAARPFGERHASQTDGRLLTAGMFAWKA